MTLVLVDVNESPVGRTTVPDATLPDVVLWNDRAYLYVGNSSAGYRYRQAPTTIELPLDSLRKAPGLS